MVGGENEVVKRSDAVANALWTPQALPESVSAWSPKHFDAASAPKSGSVRSPRRFFIKQTLQLFNSKATCGRQGAFDAAGATRAA